MLNAIVNIESRTNRSFGTGFVIDRDEKGVYVLTCKHVLKDVVTPIVEEHDVKIIAEGDFIDLAVIYIKDFHFKAIPLSLSHCKNGKVKVIAFSSFNKSVNQKKHIQATLYNESIELHSTKDERYYSVQKIQTEEGYTFDRGNSGAPVICEKTGDVIAVLSNKEGNKMGYAVDISYLQEIWSDMPINLLKNPQKTTLNIQDSTEKIIKNIQIPQTFFSKNQPNLQWIKMKRYLLPLVAFVSFLAGGYFLITPEPELIKNYKVINIRNNNTLTVRTGNGKDNWIKGGLPFNAKNIHLIECLPNNIGEKWCNIQYGNVKGWVNAQYLTEDTSSFTQNTHNTKPINEENQDIRLQFTYPPSVKREDSIILTATLTNEGVFESSGGITLSFPQRPIIKYSIITQDFGLLQKYKIGQPIYNNHKRQADKMEAIHPTIESNDINWEKGEKHHFSIALKVPKELNYLKIRVRASLTLNRIIPNEGMIDQQGFASREIIINIED